MGYKTITQIILTAVALTIIFVYVKPTLIAIRETQDELFQYADATEKASDLNQQLANLVNIQSSFKNSDKIALNEYLPSSIDQMAIMADIATVAEQNDILILSLTAGEVIFPAEDSFIGGERIVSDATTHLDFNLDLEGSYESLKNFLKAIERNKYPLEIRELSFGEFTAPEIEVISREQSLEGTYTFILRTYAYSHVGN